MKKFDIIMSVTQMNVHYIYITNFRVTEIEVVSCIFINNSAAITSCSSQQSVLLISLAAMYV